MAVPREVREAALNALATRRPDVTLLEVLHDSVLDGPPATSVPVRDADRSIVFGEGHMFAQVQVAYRPQVVELSVHLVPVGMYRVEATSPTPQLSVVAAGLPPLELPISGRGPRSLVITDLEHEVGRQWQTSWLVF